MAESSTDRWLFLGLYRECHSFFPGIQAAILEMAQIELAIRG